MNSLIGIQHGINRSNRANRQRKRIQINDGCETRDNRGNNRRNVSDHVILRIRRERGEVVGRNQKGVRIIGEKQVRILLLCILTILIDFRIMIVGGILIHY